VADLARRSDGREPAKDPVYQPLRPPLLFRDSLPRFYLTRPTRPSGRFVQTCSSPYKSHDRRYDPPRHGTGHRRRWRDPQRKSIRSDPRVWFKLSVGGHRGPRQSRTGANSYLVRPFGRGSGFERRSSHRPCHFPDV